LHISKIKSIGKKKLQYQSIDGKTLVVDNFSLNGLNNPNIFDQSDKKEEI
jgi:hypothetical protein